MHVRLEPAVLGVGVVAVASTEPPPPVTDNVFIPTDRDLGECITAVPKPGCGSEARSDWHQGLVLSVMVAGLFIIGWRIARGIRRGEAKHTDIDVTSP